MAMSSHARSSRQRLDADRPGSQTKADLMSMREIRTGVAADYLFLEIHYLYVISSTIDADRLERAYGDTTTRTDYRGFGK
jgi:hypothetical protein